jgi:Flp pilus assembly protein TadB
VATLETAIGVLIELLRQFSAMAAAFLTQLEELLRSQLQQFGVPQAVQTLIFVAIAAILILWSLRLFGGLFRIAALLVLLLIAAHIVLPTVPY